MKKLLFLYATILLSATSVIGQQTTSALAVYTNSYIDNGCTTGAGLGAIFCSISGGTGPYSFEWSNGAITQDITNLTAGTYTVTVTDANSDTASSSQVIIDIPQGSLYGIRFYPPTHGAANGNIYLGGYPGTQFDLPMQFNYYNSITAAQINHMNAFGQYDASDTIPAGNYIVTTTSAAGCTGSATIEFTEFPDFSPYVTTVDACNGSTNGRVVFHRNEQGPMPQGTLLNTDPITASDVFINGGTFVYILKDSVTNSILDQHLPLNLEGLDADTTFTNLAPGAYKLDFNILAANSRIISTQELYFDIGTTINCGTISGTVFHDANADCAFNFGDIQLPNIILEFLPGNYLAVSDSNGNFNSNIPYGTYTVVQHSILNYTQICPAGGFNFTLDATNLAAVISVADNVSFIPDGSVNYNTSTNARPGFPLSYSLLINNYSPNIFKPADVVFNFDPSLTFDSSSVPYTQLNSDNISFSLDSILPFNSKYIQVYFTVPVSATIGDTLFSTLKLSTALLETDTMNNFISRYHIISNSFDPNDKSVFPEGNVDMDTDLNYTIRFQNTGTDTAFKVVVMDTISSFLDITSIEAGASSNLYNMDFPSTNVVRFTFNNILLVDSNHNESLSHGFIDYKIKQKNNVAYGSTINNTADIYFDFNSPVITNTTETVIQSSTGLQHNNAFADVSVSPNPVASSLQIKFSKAMSNFKMEVFNSRGQNVMMHDGITIYAGGILNLNLSNVSSGIYLIRISSEKQNACYRIVKK